MTATSQVPLIEVKLPETGDTVMLDKYLTTGQSRELQKMMLKGSSFNTKTNQMDGVGAEVFLDMQDKAAELLIKKVNKADGTTIDFNAETKVLDYIFSLPAKDGSLLYEQINEITSESQLTNQRRKNS